jgi:hypothetical protein
MGVPGFEVDVAPQSNRFVARHPFSGSTPARNNWAHGFRNLPTKTTIAARPAALPRRLAPHMYVFPQQ